MKIQHKGWCWISYWHNLTASGTLRVHGSRKPHMGFHSIVSRTKASGPWGCWGAAHLIYLHQSGAQHGNLKVDLKNDFTNGSNRYPKTHQQTLHLLNKYSKTVVVPKMTSSEGSSFTQKGGRGGRGSKSW
jgi:hypothetical protein